MSKIMKILTSASKDAEKTNNYFGDLNKKASELAVVSATRQSEDNKFDPSLYPKCLEGELQKLLLIEMENDDFCLLSMQIIKEQLDSLKVSLPSLYQSTSDAFDNINKRYVDQLQEGNLQKIKDERQNAIDEKKIGPLSIACSKYEHHLNVVIASYGNKTNSQGYQLATEKLEALQGCKGILIRLTESPDDSFSDLCGNFQTEFNARVNTFSKKRDISDYKFINAIRDIFSSVAGLILGKNSLWNKSEGAKVAAEVDNVLSNNNKNNLG